MRLTGSAGQGVTLDQLLAHAERYAPALRVSSTRRQHGEAAREGASPWLRGNPTLDFGIGPRLDENRTGLDFFTSIGQPIEIGGQRGLRLDAADRLTKRLSDEVDLTRWELRRQIVLAYASGVVAREGVRIAERLMEFSEEMLRIARRRLAAGEVSLIDVRLAESEAARAQHERIISVQALEQSRLELCELTGWPLESPPLPNGPFATLQVVPPLKRLLSMATDAHPELRVKGDAVAETQAHLELSDRESWPTPILGASVAREAHGLAPNYIVLGTLGMALPLWQRNQTERARMRVEKEVANVELAAATLRLRARIARGHSRLAAAAEQVRVLSSAIGSTLESSLALLRRGFEAGEIPLVNVTVAREKFLQTQRDALASYLEYYRAFVELEASVGRKLSDSTISPKSTR